MDAGGVAGSDTGTETRADTDTETSPDPSIDTDTETSPDTSPDPGTTTVTGYVYADNYFELYVNGTLQVVDPIAFTPHQAVAVSFEVPATGPRTYAFLASDFATDSGYEYTGTANPKLGDGGIILALSDGTVSNTDWRCMTVLYGPTEASDDAGCGPTNLEACEIEETAVPADWASAAFDDAGWYAAVEFTAEAVGWGRTPSYVDGACCTLTDPYTKEDADPSCLEMPSDACLDPEPLSWGDASFVWGADLERVNKLLCRLTVEASAPSDPPTDPEPDASRCEVIEQSITSGGFGDAVTVTCDDTYAWLGSTTYPDHDLMNGITGTNEQVPVPAAGFSAPIPLAPSGLDGVTSRDSALGIAINGVPIYDYTSAGELDPTAAYDANKDVVVTGQLDVCGGHAGRGDDYHYHKAPNCMMDAMGDSAATAIIGWAYDGYPIYGFSNPDGSTIPDDGLDLCNGMTDDTFGYRYHASVEPPYILQCLRGVVDDAILPRVPPLKAAAGSPQKPDGKPPQGGVQDLVFEEDDQGHRSMTYSYQGASYFIDYEPSGVPNCYNFTMNTVTAGEVEGEYCRE